MLAVQLRERLRAGGPLYGARRLERPLPGHRWPEAGLGVRRACRRVDKGWACPDERPSSSAHSLRETETDRLYKSNQHIDNRSCVDRQRSPFLRPHQSIQRL